MIIEYIRYQLPAGGGADFEAAYHAAGPSLEASPHCNGWEMSRCIEEPEQYIVRIEWDSVDGHLQGFRRSAEFRSFFAAIRPYVDNILEMRHYELLTPGRD